MTIEWLIALAVGIAIGVALGWLIAAVRIRGAYDLALRQAETKQAAAETSAESLRADLERLREESAQTQARLREVEIARAEVEARAQEIAKRLEEERALLADAERKLSDTFKSLAAETLSATTDDLLKRATEKFQAERDVVSRDFEARHKAIDDLVRPARESLGKLDDELKRIERERSQAQGMLRSQLETLGSQTGKLVDALKTPVVRGRWGEVQLRNVVEIAGMIEHCDFVEQESLATDAGRLRPDMIIRLPGDKNVVVDSKAPLKAYIESLDATEDASRLLKLREHAGQIRKHVDQLSSKAYWDACKPAPEFVVLFLPGEMFFSAALQQDSTLLEDAWAKKVVIATPTTLMAVLRSVAFTWRQERIAENAQRISDTGQALYERLATMAEHLMRMGSSLKSAVDHYNGAVGSLERSVLPAARRFRELGVAGKKEIAELEPVEAQPRELAAPEFTERPERAGK